MINLEIYRERGVRGYYLTLLKYANCSVYFNARKGVHVMFGAGLGPLDFSIGLGVWDKEEATQP